MTEIHKTVVLPQPPPPTWAEWERITRAFRPKAPVCVRPPRARPRSSASVSRSPRSRRVRRPKAKADREPSEPARLGGFPALPGGVR